MIYLRKTSNLSMVTDTLMSKMGCTPFLSVDGTCKRTLSDSTRQVLLYHCVLVVIKLYSAGLGNGKSHSNLFSNKQIYCKHDLDKLNVYS